MTRAVQITDVKTVLLTGPCSGDPYIRGSRRLRACGSNCLVWIRGHLSRPRPKCLRAMQGIERSGILEWVEWTPQVIA